LFHLTCLLVLTFVCSWFGSLFTNYTTMFVTLKGRKQCWPFRFLFWDATNVVTFFTMDKNKTSYNITRIWHYLSIYFSILNYLYFWGFLRMFLLLIVDFFFSKFFKKSMLFVFATWWPLDWICIYNVFKIKFVLLVKFFVWSM
jgi:hypothetical protein